MILFSGGSDGKVSALSAGDQGSIPRLGRSPGEGNGNPLQYSCLENSMDGGACWATVHAVTKSWIQLSDFSLSLSHNPLGLASQVAQTEKNLPAMGETWVRSLGWENPLEEDMTTHSSILTWRIPIDRGAWQATVHRVAKSRTC